MLEQLVLYDSWQNGSFLDLDSESTTKFLNKQK